MEAGRLRPASARRGPSWLRNPWLPRGLAALALVMLALVAYGFHARHAIVCVAGAFWFVVASVLFGLVVWGWRRTLKLGALAVLVVSALSAGAVAVTFWIYARDPRLPSVDQLKNYHPKQVTRILAHDGTLLSEIYSERRTVVKYDDLPPLLVDAFVAAEDEHFWEHGGVDFKGMLRAFVTNLFSGETKQGASTITQQVIKNLLLTPERTFRRKIQEVILARRLEDTLTKKEIFALYVNQIYLGQGRYGVVEAARYYFGHELSQLTPCEIAYLASLPPAPEAISSSKKEGLDHFLHVINRLVDTGKLDRATAQTCANTFDVPPYEHEKHPAIAPEVADLVTKDLEEKVGKDKLDTLGTEVRATVRPDVETLARAALQKRLRAYDKSHKVGVPVRKIAAKDTERELARLKKALPDDGPAEGDGYAALVTKVDDADHSMTVDLGGVTAKVPLDGDDSERFNPDHKKPSQRFTPGDEVNVEMGKPGQARLEPGPEGAVVVIDVKTRDVLALVGGFHVHPGELDRAVQAHRQAGSTFKPFTYAAAIASKKYTPATVINDAPDVYGLYKPKDYEATFQGPVRLRYALAQSINTVAIRVCADLGPPAVAAMAHAMGIESDLPDRPTDYAVTLGAGAVTPLELTNAFATFAAGGMYAPPRVIESLGGTIEPRATPTRALAPDVSYVILDMMRSVLEKGGTGAGAAKDLKVPVVGKTGTSNDERDAWFVGLTPDYAIGVWVGYDDNRPLGKKQVGGALALPVFVDVINQIGVKGHRFERPDGVVVAKIDKASGLLAPPDAKPETTIDEVFLDGTAPTETAPSAGQVDTNTFVTDEYGDTESAGSGSDDAEPASHP